MQDHERDFLIAEFEQAWAMILNIDERRLKFVEYYSSIFTAVVAVCATLITWRGTIDATVAAPLTVLLVVGVLVGFTCRKMIESERQANLRYRKKINLLRGLFLEGTSDARIEDYATNHGHLGVLTPKHPTEPSGIGSTLSAVLLALRIEVSVLVLAIPALWLVVILDR